MTAFQLELWQAPTHAEARELVWWACREWASRGKLETVTALLVERVQAIAWLEAHYGAAWKTPGDGSANWGAIQHKAPVCAASRHAGDPWLDSPCFSYTDSSPRSDGTSKPYSVCFRRWPSHQEGALALVEQVVIRRPTVLQAALKGTVRDFSAALYGSRYYEGWGKTVDERIQHHADAAQGSIRLANAAIANTELPFEERTRIQALIERTGRAFITADTLIEMARADMTRERDELLKEVQ